MLALLIIVCSSSGGEVTVVCKLSISVMQKSCFGTDKCFFD